MLDVVDEPLLLAGAPLFHHLLGLKDFGIPRLLECRLAVDCSLPDPFLGFLWVVRLKAEDVLSLPEDALQFLWHATPEPVAVRWRYCCTPISDRSFVLVGRLEVIVFAGFLGISLENKRMVGPAGLEPATTPL